jgi:hypothetical protein
MFLTASETANSVPAEEMLHLSEIMKIDFHLPLFCRKNWILYMRHRIQAGKKYPALRWSRLIEHLVSSHN